MVISDRYYFYDTAGNIVSEYKRVMVNGSEKSQTDVRYVRDNTGKAISMIQYNYSEDRSSVVGQRVYYFIYNGHPACQRLLCRVQARSLDYYKTFLVNKAMPVSPQALAGRGDVTALTDSTGTVVATYSYDEFGNEVIGSRSSVDGQRTYYFIYNGHGDVTALTDNTGTVVATYSYDEFGNEVIGSRSSVNEQGIYNPLRYSGANNAYYDSETASASSAQDGLYKMGTRYYQSDIARWLTRDDYKGEQTESQTQNRYVYVRNNPINRVDPTGNWDADYHAKTTRDGAKAAGYDRNVGNKMAEGNESMDAPLSLNHAVSPSAWFHFDLNGSLKRRQKACMKTAIYFWRKGQRERAYLWIGKGLHSVQDSYAHPKEVVGYVKHGNEFIRYLGTEYTINRWLFEFKGTYDNPAWPPGGKRAQHSFNATKRYMGYFKQKTLSTLF